MLSSKESNLKINLLNNIENISIFDVKIRFFNSSGKIYKFFTFKKLDYKKNIYFFYNPYLSYYKFQNQYKEYFKIYSKYADFSIKNNKILLIDNVVISNIRYYIRNNKKKISLLHTKKLSFYINKKFFLLN